MFISGAQNHSSRDAREVRIFYKFGKEYIGSQRAYSISGLPAHITGSRWSPMDKNSGGSYTQVETRHQACNVSNVGTSKVSSPLGGAVHSHDQSHYADKITVKKHLQGPIKAQFMAGHDFVRQSMHIRSELVAGGSIGMERSANSSTANRCAANLRRVRYRLGRPVSRQTGVRLLEYKVESQAHKLQGTDGSASVGKIIFRSSARQACPSIERQHYDCGNDKPLGGSELGFVGADSITMDRGLRKQHNTVGKTFVRSAKHTGRLFEQVAPVAVSVETTPMSVPTVGPMVGETHNRSVCGHVDSPTTQVQQSILRSTEHGSGCAWSNGLDGTQQFCESAIFSAPTSFASNKSTESMGNSYSTILESSAMDDRTAASVGHTTDIPPSNTTGISKLRDYTRANEKQAVAPVCLASLWRTKLHSLGWPERAVSQISQCWAESTLYGYNRSLQRLQAFCTEHDISFPPTQTAGLAEFLCIIADSSSRPASQIRNVQAAITALYAIEDLPNPMASFNLQRLGVALVKSGTKMPMTRTSILPVKPFRDLFIGWSSNEHLTLKELRLKAVTLLALTAMLRPSDVAPKGKMFDPEKLDTESMLFTEEMVRFLDDGSVELQLHGIKNDTDRKGFTVVIPGSSVPKIDPVLCLRCYMERTSDQRVDRGAVFLALARPFKPIASSTVASILQQAIQLAGLGGLGYSAKSFRPTAATAAVRSGCDPKTAMQLGRWKTESVFYEHYVHCKPSDDYTDKILSHQ